MTLTDFVFILIPIIVLIGLLETVLSALWLPFYMRLGIPVWRQSAQVLSREQFGRVAAQLDGTELTGTWYPDVMFKQISPHELAFRHKLGGVRRRGVRLRSPVRGMVRLQAEAYTVTVTNYLPWVTPVVLLFFLWMFSPTNRPEFSSGSGLGFLIFLLLIMAVTIGLQLMVFRQINERILEQIVRDR
ncbi:MAG: hypothetical protein H6658_17255 [Ardenticatenaceae bacterium]|nr:hypothetical protein [Ardenticatenaceae bacterium]